MKLKGYVVSIDNTHILITHAGFKALMHDQVSVVGHRDELIPTHLHTLHWVGGALEWVEQLPVAWSP